MEFVFQEESQILFSEVFWKMIGKDPLKRAEGRRGGGAVVWGHPWAETLGQPWGWSVGALPASSHARSCLGEVEPSVLCCLGAPQSSPWLCWCGPCHIGKVDSHRVMEEVGELWAGVEFTEEQVGSGCWLSPVPRPPKGCTGKPSAPLMQSSGE